jgi:hypothetical protein
MIKNNTTKVGSSDIQSDSAPPAPEKSSRDWSCGIAATGAVETHIIFIPYATLEKSALVWGKFCRWGPARYLAIKLLHLLFKGGHSLLKWGHSLYPQVMFGRSRRDWVFSISSTNVNVDASPPLTPQDHAQR